MLCVLWAGSCLGHLTGLQSQGRDPGVALCVGCVFVFFATRQQTRSDWGVSFGVAAAPGWHRRAVAPTSLIGLSETHSKLTSSQTSNDHNRHSGGATECWETHIMCVNVTVT